MVKSRIIDDPDEIDRLRRDANPISKDQVRRIHDATGIPTEWVWTFGDEGGWNYDDANDKIEGITKKGDEKRKNESINNCVEELANSIRYSRCRIKKVYHGLSDTYYHSTTDVKFNDVLVSKINRPTQDKLYRKIKSERAKARSEFQKKNLENFFDEWIKSMKKSGIQNLARMKDEIDVDKYLSELEARLGPLATKTTKRKGELFFKINKGENKTTEFKESWFATPGIEENEWNIVTEKGQNVLIKDRKIADNSVQFGILKCVCSFLNTNGGKIWIGVNNDNQIVGVSTVKKREDKFGKNPKDENVIDVIRQSLVRHLQKHFPKHSSQKITETIESASDGNQLLLISVEPTYPADSRMIQDGKEIPYVREGSMCNPKTNTWFQDYDRKRKKPLGKKL